MEIRFQLLSIVVQLLFSKCAFAYRSGDEADRWNEVKKYKPVDYMVDITNYLGLSILYEHNFLNDNNIAFSPYGLTGILVALYEGVDGVSAIQIKDAMGLPRDRNIIRIGFRDIHRRLRSYFIPKEGFLAGLAFNNENVTFRQEYKSILQFYGYDFEMPRPLPGGTTAPATTVANRFGDTATTAATTRKNSTETVLPTTTESLTESITRPTTVTAKNTTRTTTTPPATTMLPATKMDADITLVTETTTTRNTRQPTTTEALPTTAEDTLTTVTRNTRTTQIGTTAALTTNLDSEDAQSVQTMNEVNSMMDTNTESTVDVNVVTGGVADPMMSLREETTTPLSSTIKIEFTDTTPKTEEASTILIQNTTPKMMSQMTMFETSSQNTAGNTPGSSTGNTASTPTTVKDRTSTKLIENTTPKMMSQMTMVETSSQNTASNTPGSSIANTPSTPTTVKDKTSTKLIENTTPKMMSQMTMAETTSQNTASNTPGSSTGNTASTTTTMKDRTSTKLIENTTPKMMSQLTITESTLTNTASTTPESSTILIAKTDTTSKPEGSSTILIQNTNPSMMSQMTMFDTTLESAASSITTNKETLSTIKTKEPGDSQESTTNAMTPSTQESSTIAIIFTTEKRPTQENEATEKVETTTAEPTETTTLNEATDKPASRRKKSVFNYDFIPPPDRLTFYRPVFLRNPNYEGRGLQHHRSFLANGYSKVQTTYMTYDAVLEFAYIPFLKSLALKLPLDTSEYYLLILLPEYEFGINQLIKDLHSDRAPSLKQINYLLANTYVRAWVPSFMLKGFIVLTSDLQKLGICDVFEPRQDDFKPMTAEKNIYVRNIEQAITVTIRKYMEPNVKKRYAPGRRPVEFAATHPFLYFVMDSALHVALMAGKIVNPLNSRIL